MDENPNRLQNEWIGCGIVGIIVLAISGLIRVAMVRSNDPQQIVSFAAMSCMTITIACGSGVVLIGIVRAVNRRDDPRHAKRPSDPP
jgi:hypothetical protein